MWCLQVTSQLCVFAFNVSMNWASCESVVQQLHSRSWNDERKVRTRDETLLYFYHITHPPSSSLYIFITSIFNSSLFQLHILRYKTFTVFVQQVASDARGKTHQLLFVLFFVLVQLLKKPRRPTDLWKNKCPLRTSSAETEQRRWSTHFIHTQPGRLKRVFTVVGWSSSALTGRVGQSSLTHLQVVFHMCIESKVSYLLIQANKII